MSIQFAKPADLQTVQQELDASLKNNRVQLRFCLAMFEVYRRRKENEPSLGWMIA